MSSLILHLQDGEVRTVEIRPGEPLTLGRADDNAISLPDGTVSRRHARLTWQAGDLCLLEDLQSANGTTINDAPLAGLATLRDGDRLAFGAITAVYYADEADDEQMLEIELTIGETFAGRYRVARALGETDEYNNFQALDLVSEPARVSLKIFHPGVAGRAGGFERIRQEFARVRAVPAHPGLVGLRDFARWRGVCHLAAEWIEGYPLLDLLRRRSALSVREAMRLARPAAAATDHARTHHLLTPELALRAAILAFDQPLSPEAWEKTLALPLERWPAFDLKLTPCLFEPPAADPLPTLAPLATFVYELLGYPASARSTFGPTRIAGLNEAGNAVLASGGGVFDNDAAFIDALGQAAGVAMPGEPPAPGR